MFSSRKDDKVKKPRRGGNLAQFGLMDVPDLDNIALGNGDSDGDDDAALEAELLALTGGGGQRRQPQQGTSTMPTRDLLYRRKGVVSQDQLSHMVSQCMRDDDGDDGMLDEDDPELLAELSALGPGGEDEDYSPPSRPTPERSDYRNPEPRTPWQAPMAGGVSVLGVLAERRIMYEQAEAHAVAGGETSRARRFNRGLKTILQMEKSVRAGRDINEDDIPPPVLVKGGGGSRGSFTPAAHSPFEERERTPPSVPPHASPPATIPHDVVFQDRERLTPQLLPRVSLDNQVPRQPGSGDNPPVTREPPPPLPARRSLLPASDPVSIISTLHNQYKAAAVAAKRSGDKERAVQYMRTMKQMKPMLDAAQQGQPVDLTSLPGPPSASGAPSQPRPTPREPPPFPVESSAMTPPEPPPVETVTPVGNSESAPGGPVVPASVLEALQQRLAKYTEQRDKAKNEENSRKERMNQRIIKQYEDAIKKHNAGKPVEYDELPTPPGFPPIPVGSSMPAGAPAPTGGGEGTTAPPAPSQGQQGPAPLPTAALKPTPPPPTNVRQAPKSRVERQMSFLTKRQGQFKEAALEAKKRGEIEQAKEYLRMSKGFDTLIDATRGGLPVDMNTVPVPPQEQISTSSSTDFELVSSEDCVTAPENVSADTAITYTKLEEDLIAQIKMCAQTREHFKATGDVASANRFEQLILHTKKDLDAVRAGFKHGTTPPRFHYETRSFSIIQCNTDLNDSDCEVVVLRGINFNVQNPKEVDTYIRLEFPYPSDNPPQDRSCVIKDTNNPEYNHKTIFSVDRKSRALARVFKRHSIKMQVYAKGGWFHRDTVLGTVKAPLVALETKCTLHDSFDLMDDRKRMVGGKLEVKIRVRNPIVTKQLEKVSEKWLVIDGF